MDKYKGKTIAFFGGFRIKEGLFIGDKFAAEVY